MKILILHDNFPPQSFGGAELIAFYYAKAMKDKGHQISVITAVQDRALEGEFEYEGLKIFRIYSKYHPRFQAYLSLYNPYTVSKVRKIIQDIKPDVVHAHNIHYHLSYHSFKLAKDFGAKVFLTIHDALLFHYGKVNNADKVSAWSLLKKYKRRYNPFRNLIIRRYLRYVDKIIPVCFAMEKALNNNGIRNTQVLHNGIRAEEFRENKEATERFRSKFDLRGKKVMFFGGRISEAKGGDVALNLLVEISKVIPEARLIIAGRENSYVSELIKKAGALGVKNKVKILGWLNREEIVSAYYASDLVLTPSLYLDSFPTVNLEAMATKRPVIATSLDGAKEAIIDGEAGYIVDPTDLPLLVSRTLAILSDETLARTLGQNGHERFLKDFQLSNQADKLERIYLS